mgnify:CR=1 FL=1
MVERVKFLPINVDYKTYNRIIRVTTRDDGGASDLIVSKDLYLEKLFEKNEFIRLKCDKYYADIKVKTWFMEDQTIVISFGALIDYSKAVIFPKDIKVEPIKSSYFKAPKEPKKVAQSEPKKKVIVKVKTVIEVSKEEIVKKVYIQLPLF